MIRTLIVLCLALGGVDAFGQEKEEENKSAKKEKKSEKWYGIAAGLSQFYLKDELGSYLRYDGQPRSFAGLSLNGRWKSHRRCSWTPQARPTAQWVDVSTHGVKGLYRGHDKL